MVLHKLSVSLLKEGIYVKLPKALALVVFLWVSIFCTLIYIALSFLLTNFLPAFLPFLIPFILSLLLFLWTYICILLSRFNFQIKDNILYIKSGLIFRKDKRFVLTRMVSIKTFSTPFMRLLKLEFILITFEGSIYILPPVSADFAEEILDNTTGRQGYEEV